MLLSGEMAAAQAQGFVSYRSDVNYSLGIHTDRFFEFSVVSDSGNSSRRPFAGYDYLYERWVVLFHLEMQPKSGW